jgi:hypothetical protein
VIQDVPELRIVDEVLWNAVKSRQAGLKRPQGGGAENSFRNRCRPKYLLWAGTVRRLRRLYRSH